MKDLTEIGTKVLKTDTMKNIIKKLAIIVAVDATMKNTEMTTIKRAGM